MGVPVVSLSGIVRDYGNGRPALSEVDLLIEPGRLVAIIGRSGSGKSTLLNIIGLLDRADEGKYEFLGEDISKLPERTWCSLRAHYLGFVFQAFHLIDHRTVTENVALGAVYTGVSSSARQRRAAELIERLGLGERARALPATLSGGERQRVAIARALMGEPLLLLCDEPTGNLDTESASLVMSTLRELNAGGTTVIVVTHDLDVASQAHEHIRLVDGRISGPGGR